MSVNLSPIGNDAPFVDSNGSPLSGGLLYAYTAGSSAPQNTYTTILGNVSNANPIVLNSSGYPDNEIWLTAGALYKFILKTAVGVTLWDRDNISGINDTTVSQSEWISGPAPTYISATSFSLVGDQTGIFQVGRRVKTTNSGGTVYGTISSSAFSSVTTIVVANDSGVLDSGLSAVSYGIISATNTSVPAGSSNSGICDGRLTLTTGVPINTSATGGTLYFTPYKGKNVSLYDGSSRWIVKTFSELSIAVPNLANTNYDVFVYDSAGTTTLELVAWTNDTTRATGIVLQDGVYVKSGTATHRYLGSVRSGSGLYSAAIVDSAVCGTHVGRYLWNYYNRIDLNMFTLEVTDNWTYSTATWRQANGNANNQLEFIIGVSENAVSVDALGLATNSGSTLRAVYTGIGVDVTNANSANLYDSQNVSDTLGQFGHASYKGLPGVGRHFITWLEKGAGSDTQTWYGDGGGTVQCGLNGMLRG